MSEDKAALFLNYWRLLTPRPDVWPESEYHFDEEIKRKHRFDFAFPNEKLAIEIDGGQFKPKGGRHAGELDKEKMNLAAMLGWRVMHYTPQMIKRDPIGMVTQIMKALGANE